MSNPTIVCMMKNEAPFILEWLAYHKVIGFQRFVIFSNDSADGTTEILDQLHAAGEIEHHYHKLNDEDVLDNLLPQLVLKLNPFDEGDWVIWLDADEFINIHLGDGRITTLIDKINPAQGMTICWRVFGDSGQHLFEGRFVSEKFTRCAKKGRAWQNVKTIFRFDDNVTRLFNHKPMMTDRFWKEGGRFVNPLGITLNSEGKFMRLWVAGKKRGKIDEAECSWSLAQINHYAVRTHALFQEKIARGSAGENQLSENLRYGDRYFRGLNLNDREDRSILRWEGLVSLEIDRLLGVSELMHNYKSLLKKSYPRSIVNVD